jgi:hypothetical protein
MCPIAVAAAAAAVDILVSAAPPVRNMDQPTMGMRKLLVLLMNLNGRCRWNRL